MENSGRSAPVIKASPDDHAQPQTVQSPGPCPWIVSAKFDLLFLANLGWVLLLIPGLLGEAWSEPLGFWQIYYLTTPHRWLTLFLVAFDPDRRQGIGSRLIFVGLILMSLVGGVYWFTGSFLCLVWIDFLWNAWHFGSQHAGVARIYDRKLSRPYSAFEKYGLRVLVVYTIVRIPGWFGTGLGSPWSETLDNLGDPLALSLAVAILVHGVRGSRWADRGRLAYLASVCSLYGLMNLARWQGWHGSLDGLFLAASLFHAIEYLAIVTHYARGRADRGSGGAFQAMARRWTLVLAVYLVVLGSLDILIQEAWITLAVGLNLTAALMHYAYDGMIWKLRRAETARSLGVS